MHICIMRMYFYVIFYRCDTYVCESSTTTYNWKLYRISLIHIHSNVLDTVKL